MVLPLERSVDVKHTLYACLGLLACVLSSTSWGNELDKIVAAENTAAGIKEQPLPIVNDQIFMRRIYVDLIGRIPTEKEVRDFAKQPPGDRREKLIDELLKDPRFADRWTLFYADMLRIRSQATGGANLMAYVHNSLKNEMPYDEICLLYTSDAADE